jgi:hypothetical protein
MIETRRENLSKKISLAKKKKQKEREVLSFFPKQRNHSKMRVR